MHMCVRGTRTPTANTGLGHLSFFSSCCCCICPKTLAARSAIPPAPETYNTKGVLLLFILDSWRVLHPATS